MDDSERMAIPRTNEGQHELPKNSESGYLRTRALPTNVSVIQEWNSCHKQSHLDFPSSKTCCTPLIFQKAAWSLSTTHSRRQWRLDPSSHCYMFQPIRIRSGPTFREYA